MRRRGSKRIQLNQKNRDQVAVWSIDILLELGGWKSLSKNYSFTRDENSLRAIGLEHLEDEEITKQQFLKALKEQREKHWEIEVLPDNVLCENVGRLADYIGLNKVEKSILLFCVILKKDKGLMSVADTLGELSAEDVMIVLAEILNLNLKSVREALSKERILVKSGLLKVDRESSDELQHKLDILDGLPEVLEESGVTVDSMLEYYFCLADKAVLKEDDYDHVADRFSLVQAHLEQAQRSNMSGVNILVYGPPGSGKTEFAKTVVETMGYKLYEVNIGDEDRPFNKPGRLRAYQLAQQVLSRKKKALILFDEVDSILAESRSFFIHDGDSLNLKACVNKSLETNISPAIWIANDIQYADTAFIRRFDIVFHLEHPPRSKRLAILNDSLHGTPVRREWVERLADNKDIAPAVVSRAIRVVGSLESIDPEKNENMLEQILESTLTAMGHPKNPIVIPQNNISYRLDAVNPDHDLAGIVQGLKTHGEGRLCLYGPPGTGKTEFGHYLAKQMDKPLLVKRSSDLLGPYVGETEAKIAGMFQEANYDDAVLLLDEADSFLRDRTSANRSWEVTQVNELLTQMERFNGVFVCSTNLMESLDAASLRRFDMKVKFDYLKADQAWEMFSSIFIERGVKLKREKYWQKELSKCRDLTPGDFATIVRKNRFGSGSLSPESMLKGLYDELSFKSKMHFSRPMGFTANV